MFEFEDDPFGIGGYDSGRMTPADIYTGDVYDDKDPFGIGGYDIGYGTPNYDYGDEYHKGMGGAEGTPSEGIKSPGTSFDFLGFLKSIGSKGLDYIKNNPGQTGLMAALAALGALSKAPPSGGGTTKRYVGPAQQLTRTVTQGKYGPIAQYAAQGGIMHAYAEGGKTGRAYADGQPLTMEDGGFVMTGDAVRGARNVAGPQGIRALLPGAQMISAPGGPTDDRGKTAIVGKDGRLTPALVSNGEAYIPRRAQPPGGTRELYAMMRQLERRA